MATVRDAVFAAVVSYLEGIGDALETELMPSGAPVLYPARHIFDGGQRVLEAEAGTTRYELSLTIEGYLEQAGGAEAHSNLNDLYAATVAALMADEPPLGGLAETVDEADLRVVVAELASKSRLGFGLDIIITFSARRDDPAQPA